MKIFNIDLYAYFNLDKPQTSTIEFTCYIHEDKLYNTRKYPAMLVLAGGGYEHCSSREKEPIALKYFAEGFNVFILNYSVAPNRYPVSFLEASMAMAYIKKESRNLDVIFDKVSAVGFSAGGHLCGLLATNFASPVLDVLGENKKLVRPDLALLIYPVISYKQGTHQGSFDALCGKDENLKNSLSIETLVTKESSPMFIVSTFEDKSVPCVNSLLLAKACFDNGLPFALHIYEKGKHGMSTGDNLAFTTKEPIPPHSKDFDGWIDLSINHLRERGFVLFDE